MRLGAATEVVGEVSDGGPGPLGLASFCEAESPRLVGTLTLYCGDRGTAEELAQEALVRVWRHWPTVAEAATLGHGLIA